MRRRYMKRLLACAIAAAVTVTSFDVTGYLGTTEVQASEGTINAETENSYDFDKTKDWDELGTLDITTLKTDSTPAVGTTLNMDILLPVTEENQDGLDFNGQIKTGGILRIGSNWDWAQSDAYPALGKDDFTEKVTIGGTDYWKAAVSIVFGETVGANDPETNTWSNSMSFEKAVTDVVNAVTVKIAGYQCDYSGKIAIANAALTNTEASTGDTVTALKTWNFDDGIGGWQYFSGWEWQYDGAENSSVEADNGKLKVNVDYSADGAYSWSQLAIGEYGDVSIKGATRMTFDFYYDSSLLDGGFSAKRIIQYQQDGSTVDLPDAYAAIDTENAQDVGDGIKKASVTIDFDAISQDTCSTVGVCIIGVNTTYKGAVWIDNLAISSVTSADDVYVDSTKKADDTTALSVSDQKLNTKDAQGATVSTSIADSIKLVDANATDSTKSIYAYLKAVGDSDSVIFGHQNDTWHKAGSSDLSNSDTTDVTGSISGVVGIDALSLTGNEYSAARYNSEIGDQTFPTTAAGNVAAAAALTNKNIEEGAIITLSAHMPNFSIVKESADYDDETDPSYAKYDFSGYSPNNLTGDVMNEILPGGKYNEKYNAYLDMIADYASQVNGTILFRPFHENTGSWFWWGAAFCDAATYKNVYRYTVEYLRDTKDIHNLLYVYGPGSEAASVAEYSERYPGDDYVDMVGFDMYHSAPTDDDSWFSSFSNELSIVQQFAEAHDKLITVTETGVANSTDKGDNQTALHKSGNQHLDWYNEMLDAVSGSGASYFLLWANFGEKDGFYTPYVKSVNEDGSLHGQEELDYFIDFFNDPRSVFASNQKEVLASLTDSLTVTADPVTTEATGYITAPVSGKRILDPITLSANISGLSAGDTVTFALRGSGDDVVLDAVQASSGSKVWSSALTAEKLALVGEAVGSIELRVNGNAIDTISATFNLEAAEEDPYEIDGFENYSGVDSLLTQKWATNKASGSTISLSLSKADGTYCSGSYGMKFTYNETSTGWAGATISKVVDWSDCNALQFWTIPDGNNQKVVIQLTANGKVYEAYLNNYTGYTNTTKPMLVTIPFSEFVQRDTAGNPAGGLVADSASVTSFGLWVNAIAGSDAVDSETGMVSGTIYYDKITAVSTDADAATFGNITVSDITDSTATAYLIGETTGTYYYEVLAADAEAPVDGAAIEAADAVDGIVAGNGEITQNQTKAVPLNDLSAKTAYKLYATVKDSDGNYTEVQSAGFTTKKQTQEAIAVTGVPTGSIAYGSSFILSTTGGSNDAAVSYEVTSGTDYATVDSTTGAVTVTGVGDVTITATKAGDDSYEPAVAKVSFTTVKANQAALVITGVPETVRQNDSFTLGVTGGSGSGKVTYKITSGSDYATIDSATGNVTVTGIGTVTVKATKALTEVYNKVTTEITFTSGKMLQSELKISGVPSSVTYGSSFTLQTTGGSGTGAVSYAVTKGSSYAKVDSKTGAVSVTGVGAVEITVTKAADSDYNTVTKTVSFTSVKANQSALSIKNAPSSLSAEKTVTLSTKGGSGTGAVTYAVTSGSKYAKVDKKTGKVTVTGIGSVTITATKAADANYNQATAKVTFKTVLPAKNTKLTIGSLKYQITKSDSKKGTVTCYAPADKKATSLSIPKTVKIAGVSFAVTAIEANAFKSCTKLKTVTIGDNVTKIGDAAFYKCTALSKVTIGAGVTTIGKNAFYGDGKLKNITIDTKNLTKVGASAFKGIDSKAVIKVPSSKLKAYTSLLKGKGQVKTVKIKK